MGLMSIADMSVPPSNTLGDVKVQKGPDLCKGLNWKGRFSRGGLHRQCGDFPGAAIQGFALQEARLMIASAIEELAQALLEDGKALPVPMDDAQSADADSIELVPLPVHAGTAPR